MDVAGNQKGGEDTKETLFVSIAEATVCERSPETLTTDGTKARTGRLERQIDTYIPAQGRWKY